MNFRQKITIVLLLQVVLCSVAFAQVVEIPDPNLRNAVRHTLNLPDDTSLTQAAMKRLTELEARDMQITRLTGLEYAINLRSSNLSDNDITDISPLAALTKLEYLLLQGNPIHDLAPLANLTQLKHFKLRGAPIFDLTPLARLTSLEELVLERCGITDITPLAVLSLHELWLWDNLVTDLSPLANMTTLTQLDLGSNRISDISLLGNLTNLTVLKISGNQISDITPLSNLAQLTVLEARNNKITDVTPLANLTRLENLRIRRNLIFDHSPLDGLALTVFEYDDYQACDDPPRPLQPRLENRSFPSVFSAWGGEGWSSVLNQPHLSDSDQMAQHDLYWGSLRWGHEFYRNGDTWDLSGHRTSDYLDVYFEKNPNMIYLGAFGLLDVDLSTYPPDSPYWLRDSDGEINRDHGGGSVDLTHPGVQRDIIQKAVAIANCGLYDGVFFDFWGAFRYSPAEVDGLVAIVKGIRANTRENFLIIGNTNDQIAPATGPYINGLFMETAVPGKAKNPSKELTKLENTLLWAAKNLRKPQVIALEGHAYVDQPLDSPTNLRSMRAITTLGLTFSDGYVLFITNMWEGKHMHWHYWYDFWDADLGQPVGPKSQLYHDAIPGLYIREFTNGWAVYNHSGSAQIVTLPEEVQSVATGMSNTAHPVLNLDGDIFLKLPPALPGDINGDGVVNIFDLTLVAQAFGKDGLEADVNGDGVINVFDLVFVANQF